MDKSSEYPTPIISNSHSNSKSVLVIKDSNRKSSECVSHLKCLSNSEISSVESDSESMC